MKILLYTLILAAVLLFPNQGTDVGKLIPVEVIAVSESKGTMTIRTDTGNQGNGKTLADAIRDLKAAAPGVIYLDTAEYLLLEPGLEETIKRSDCLKRNTKVYYAWEGIAMDGIANYLSVHQSDVQIKEISNAVEIPLITEDNGRYSIIQK